MKLNPLSLSFNEKFSFDNFVLAENQANILENINYLKNLRQQKNSLSLIIAPNGAGKTHLLKAAINFYKDQDLNSLYLPLKQIKIEQIPALIEKMDLVCLDDIQIDLNYEQQLFIYDLINKNQIHLILASEIHPNQLKIIADLKTRLLSAQILIFPKLTDQQKLMVFKMKCKERSVQLSHPVFRQFLVKSDRNLHQMMHNLEKLIHFAGTKKISLSLLKQFFTHKLDQ